MSSLEVNNQILSPVDSFILEYRARLAEDQKKLEEKFKKMKNPESRASAPSTLEASVSNMKLGSSEPLPTIMVTDCGNKENISKNQNIARNTISQKTIASNVTKGGSDFMKKDRAKQSNRVIRSIPTNEKANETIPTRNQEKKALLIREPRNRYIPSQDREKQTTNIRNTVNENNATRNQGNENVPNRNQDNEKKTDRNQSIKNLPTRNQENIIPTRNQENIIPTRNQENIIPTRNQENIIPTRNQENIIPTRNQENIIPTRNQENKTTLIHNQGKENIPTSNHNTARTLHHETIPCSDQENLTIPTPDQASIQTITTRDLITRTPARDHITGIPTRDQVNLTVPSPEEATLQTKPTRDHVTRIPGSDHVTRVTPSRDEEKQRFIDRLISSPSITSPRDESDTPKSRRVLTPDLPLPVNQRQADIEKLQNLFSQSPSYVPNLNDVNQFSESYVLASSPAGSQGNTADLENQEAADDSDLFDSYVKTFECENHHETNGRVCAPPMSITTNNFAHDQSCKKIIKIGEYSPLNPHFVPQPSVLDFSSRYHERGSQTPDPPPDGTLRHCQRDKRSLDAQMPSKKKSKAVQICGPSSSFCTDDDIEVIGTKITSLPDIETKVNPEARYPHLRSQHHVETCGGGDPMATVKLKQELYKTELDRQIREKRLGEEARRRREVEEDEKAQRAYEEQQERLRREFELEEASKLQSAMQRQMREELLKEKIRELQIQQEEEKARRRREKEASQGRYRREVENRQPWGSMPPQAGNPSSIMQPNPFGAAVNPRLEPIKGVSEAPTYSGGQGNYLAPPARHRGASPARDVSPCRSLLDDAQTRHGPQPPRSRDVSPMRPPIERFRDISPVRPLRETLPGSPSLGGNKEEEGALISNAPLELSMPLRRGKHHRVSFIRETSTSPPPQPRSTSPVLPAVRTHHRMKDLAATSPCPETSEAVLKNATNRNVLTQLGQFRRQLYLENLRMNERLRQNEFGDGCK